MDSTILLKYNDLNFNLKNIIFSYLPLNQLFSQIAKINKLTPTALNKIRVINFMKNNFYK